MGQLNLELAYRLTATMAFAIEPRPEKFANLLPELPSALTVAALTSIIADNLVATSRASAPCRISDR